MTKRSRKYFLKKSISLVAFKNGIITFSIHSKYDKYLSNHPKLKTTPQ